MKIGLVKKPLIISAGMQPNVGRAKSQPPKNVSLATRVTSLARKVVNSAVSLIPNMVKLGPQGVVRAAVNVSLGVKGMTLQAAQRVNSAVKGFFGWVKNSINSSIYQPTKNLCVRLAAMVSALPQATVQTAVVRPVKFAVRLTLWTKTSVLLPAVNSVKNIAAAILNLPSSAFQKVQNGVRSLVAFGANRLVSPLANTCNTIATNLFLNLPRLINNSAIVPMARGIATSFSFGANGVKSCALAVIGGPKFLLNKARVPLQLVSNKIQMTTSKVAQGVSQSLVAIPTMVGQAVVQTKMTISNSILNPIGRSCSRSKDAIISLPSKIVAAPVRVQNSVVAPVANKIASTVAAIFGACKSVVATTIVAPAAYTTGLAARSISYATNSVAAGAKKLLFFIPKIQSKPTTTNDNKPQAAAVAA